jgi:hypothetical protein
MGNGTVNSFELRATQRVSSLEGAGRERALAESQAP